MAMYRLTITGEWDTGMDDLPVARAACEFAAENSIEAMDAARSLLTTLLGNNEDQAEHAKILPQCGVSDGLMAVLAGVLAVEVRYVESHDRAPHDLHWTAD
ncbi:MAG: hypothetical protein M3Y58_03750 [Chloroflexota bacterium]|nr:hypothetical protein [Chloroflexota bacterium]